MKMIYDANKQRERGKAREERGSISIISACGAVASEQAEHQNGRDSVRISMMETQTQ